METSQSKTASAFRSRPRAGTTLLELTVASTILAITLIPALKLMRDSLRISRQLESREVMVTGCQTILEQQSFQIATQWALASGLDRSVGQQSGYSNVLIEYAATDSASDGGIASKLAVLTVSAWDDQNANSRRDATEIAVTFATKVARLQSLTYEGQGS